MATPFRAFDALRWSAPALHLQAIWSRWRRRRRGGTAGHCPICERTTLFVHVLDNPREDPQCRRCGSVPRQRAVVHVLAELGLDLARAAVHEASPSLGTWRCLRRRCGSFTASMWLPGVRHGGRVGVFHHVDLQQQPFADAAFDLVITQDVLEHVPDPTAALREIERTLRPGGRHVFTVPRRPDQPTRKRAEWRDGELHLLAPAEYHHDPSTRAGTLVVTDWGMDLEALVAPSAAMRCEAHMVTAPGLGIPAAIEVFVATKHRGA